MKKIQKMRRMIQRKFREGIAILKDNSGLSVIEMLAYFGGDHRPDFDIQKSTDRFSQYDF